MATAVATALTAISAFVGVTVGASTAHAVADDDWLGIVNTYRQMSGLGTVSADPTWSAQAKDHSCYMLLNGISHDEIPGKPGYTVGGDTAGNSGNVAVSSSVSATARNHIDLWMTGPFHAIGILRHNLTSSGFGLCTKDSAPTPWRSGGTLDVIRGIDLSRSRPSTPIVFPGDGATVPLNRFITEYPNPMTLCGWTGNAGLPLIAMMPNDVSSANSTITGPNGPIQTCTLHQGNTGADATARAILDGDNAVVVMPREILADGTYTVTVNSNGGNVTWSFSVDADGPLSHEPPPPPEPDVTGPTAGETQFEVVTPFRLVDSRQGKGTLRLRAGKITKLAVAERDVTAVSANFTAVKPSGNGFITASNCTTELPTVSTLGYRPGQNVANQAIVPLQD
ncbi:MAG: CAP domain-containing protein, partial [Acidimicrobiia bacterium]